MGKYFGTDGFRGEANVNLTVDHAFKVGRFLGWYYGEVKRRNGDDTPARIVIGKDTRRSSYMFEYTLVGGLVDELEAVGIRTFGPRKNAAILEGSKAFSKDLMKKYNIPTAAYENFTDPAKAIEYLKTEAKFPIVLKADGLALGKGVLICKDLEEAAVVDGANILQQIWYVQLPAIKNIIVIQFILQAGNIMSIGFEKAYALQTDMNLPASEILSTYVYRIGLLNGDYGYSTAVGLFNSVINVILLIFVNWVVKKLNDGEGL